MNILLNVRIIGAVISWFSLLLKLPPTRSAPKSGDVKFFLIASSVEGDDLITWPPKLQILHIMISSCGGSEFGKDNFECFQ